VGGGCDRLGVIKLSRSDSENGCNSWNESGGGIGLDISDISVSLVTEVGTVLDEARLTERALSASGDCSRLELLGVELNVVRALSCETECCTGATYVELTGFGGDISIELALMDFLCPGGMYCLVIVADDPRLLRRSTAAWAGIIGAVVFNGGG